ncbi:MAG: hypothetical protein ABI822_08730, partial [Bryobacteraceae bacterium]
NHFGSGYRGSYSGSGFRYGGYGGYGYTLGYFPGFYSGYGLSYGYGFGNGYDYPGYNYYPAATYASAPAVYYGYDSQPSQPVVINQYYRTAAPRAQVREEAPPQPAAAVPSRAPEYWLIAFPNGSVVLAVSYWTDGNTLHYVTRNKEQKQIALSAIDRDLTQQLNGERGLEFRIPR